MTFTIKVTGLDKVQKFIAELPKELMIGVKKGGMEFMRFVQKSAKLRAPKVTGYMASQIKVKKSKGGNVITLDTGEAYYAYWQEVGFTLHIIPSAYFSQHVRSPNIPGIPETRFRKFARVSKHTPFMMPALASGMVNLPNIMKRKIKGAIDKSR